MADRKDSKPRYVSGHCGIGNHRVCAGSYAETKCHCDCGHEKPKGEDSE